MTAVDEIFDLVNVGQAQSLYNSTFDFVYDGNMDDKVIDLSDAAELVMQVMGTFAGDADLDGTVDVVDLNVVGVNWQQVVDSVKNIGEDEPEWLGFEGLQVNRLRSAAEQLTALQTRSN